MMSTRSVPRHPGRRRALSRIVATAVAAVGLASAGSASALDGPAIIGGDNFPKHGQFTAPNTLAGGWLAMSLELRYVSARVGRLNDNTVAVIGAQASAAISNDAGAAIGRAAAQAGLTVTYAEGADAINAFFERLAAGTAIPRVIWIAGNGTDNGVSTAEVTAINANGARIASFAAGGGGLIAHGDHTVYGTWLAQLLPGIEAYCCGGADGLALTPSGTAALPGLTDAAISAGAYRNAFRGNLGGLEVFARATSALDPADATAQKVLLGGGRAWGGALAPADLRVTTSGPATADRGDTITYDLTVTNRGPNVAGFVTLTDTLPPGFAYKGAVSDSGRCAGSQTVVCGLGMIAPGRSARAKVFAKVMVHGLRINNARATSGVPEGRPVDNRSLKRTRSLLTRLRVKVRVPKDALDGDLLRVRLSVRNVGRRSAKAVILRNPTPPGFTLERRPAGARVERNAAIWELGNIAPGRTRVAVFRIRVDRGTHSRWCIAGLARARNANFTSARGCLKVFLHG